MFNNSAVAMDHVSGTLARTPILSPGIQASGSSAANLNLPTGPVSYQFSFVNTMTIPITVIDRHGFRHVVPPTPTRTHNVPRFIARMKIQIRQDSWPIVESLFAGLPSDKHHVLRELQQAWELMRNSRDIHLPGHQPTKTLTLDFEIEPGVLFDRSSVYLRQMDIVVSKMDVLQAPPHPMNPDAADLPSIGSESHSRSHIQFEIVQGPDVLSPRYVAIATKVFKIQPRKDPRREAGLYLTYLEPEPDTPERMRTVQQRYSLEEMETVFGIYRTPEEALAGGDTKTIRKEELAALEHNTAVAQRELAEFKVKSEREKEAFAASFRDKENESKVQIQILEGRAREAEALTRLGAEQFEREKHALTMEALKARESADKMKAMMDERIMELKAHYEERLSARKDHYDTRSHERKDYYDDRSRHRDDSSAIVKFLPAIVLGIGALAMAVFKFMGS